MTSELVVDVQPKEVSIALLEDKQLVELQSEGRNISFSVGNMYLGRVKKLMPGLNACFVDVGYEKDAFLHYLDLGPQFNSLEKYVKQTLSDKKKLNPITKATILPDLEKDGTVSNTLKVGQEVVVQIVKEPISTKGPRLTSELSFAGRYLVLIPFNDKVSVSQKIKSSEERARLKQLLMSIKPKNFGVIVRTVAEGKRVAELDGELKVLLKHWEDAITKVQKATKFPTLIYEETSRAVGLLRDLFNPSFENIHVNNEAVYHEIKDYVTLIAPERAGIVKLYKGQLPIYDNFGITKQIKSSFGKTISYKSGAYLIIEHTEALHVVDVNSGNRTKNANGQEVYGRSYETSFSKFEQMYGPVYYSFDVGRIHYVVLDDNFFIGRDYFYIGYLEERQMRWLEKDLARVQPGSTVVVCLHIPSTCEEQDRKQFRYDRAGSTMTNHRGLYEILKPYRAHIISGHTHTTFNQSIAPGLYEHVTPALSGAWWQGPLCTDGTPAGYGVYEVNGDRIDWYYKSTGYPADYQMKIYSGREYPQFEGYAVANVWASDPAWEVQFTIDGVPCGPAERFQAYDPAAKQMYSDTSQMDHKWIYPSISDHYYRVALPEGAKRVEVSATDRFGRISRAAADLK